VTPLSPFAADWPAVSALLDEALGLPASEHAAWLEGLSGERAAHRRALRSLLAHYSDVETGDFLHELPALDIVATESPGGSLSAGGRVGTYRLIAEIGRGGMGTVWLAERADGLVKRRVALKLPRIVWGDTFAERLAHERDILATLTHAHIARLYDAGIDEQQRPFLAVEYVEGEPIDVHCRQRALPVRERITLLLQVLSAVGHAHARLVVHRDLKPSNILVDREGNVKLLDFGIAKLLEGDSTRRSALTELAGRVFTLDYASPEQIRGGPLGTASDVYSVAVVAFELLTGAKPYRLQRGSAAEIEEAIASAQPQRASDVASTAADRRALRGDLDAILNRALKKDVADRYPSIDALAEDLQRHQRGEPVQARPDSALYRSRRFIGRHRLGVAMALAVLVSVMAGGAMSAWQWRVARAEERRATTELERQSAIQDLYLETLSRLSVLGAEQPQELAKPGAVTSELVRKLAELEPRFANRPDQRAAQQWATMLQLNYDNRFAESLAVGQQYLANLEANGATAQRIILAHSALGRTLAKLGRLDESEAMRRAGMNWVSDAHDLDTELARMQISTDLGGLLTLRGKRDEASAILTRADAMIARLYPLEHLRYDNLTKIALFHLGFDDSKALLTMRQAHAELLANGTTSPDRQSQLALQLGNVLLANGQLAEAEAELATAVSVIRSQYGRVSRNALVAFGAWMDAVSRRDPARAALMIEQERLTLAATAEGLSAMADLQLRAQQLANHWLAGDTAASTLVSVPDEARLTVPAALRDNEFLLIQRARALLQSGRPTQALRSIQALQLQRPDGNAPTLVWLQIQELLAEAQLAAGQEAAAGRTAGDLLQVLEQQRAQAGRAYRVAASLGALAAARQQARQGDRELAARLLARMSIGDPPFPSPVERADCELRRAETLVALGRLQEGAAVARDALRDLSTQHPASPRLVLARRLLGSDEPSNRQSQGEVSRVPAGGAR
jgi:serine/threonine protein kinase/uncharacterized coiled-coil protein SlyX